MRISEIQVGKTYTNGKKRETIRKVTRIEFYGKTTDPFRVYFKVLKGPYTGQGVLYIFADSFARWALAEVKEAPNV